MGKLSRAGFRPLTADPNARASLSAGGLTVIVIVELASCVFAPCSRSARQRANMRGMGTSAETIGTLRNGRELVRVCCELTEATQLPEWLHLLPDGSEIRARDGRRFRVESAAQVARESELPLLIDWEHASEQGNTRAAGWLEQLELAGTFGRFPRGGLWGRAMWTPQGRADIEAKNYRFLSPTVLGTRSSDPSGRELFHVERIASVALTNRPALALHAIEAFREQLSVRFGPLASPSSRPRERGADRSPYGVDRAALRQLGLTDAQILDSERELFEEKPQADVDRAALKRLGFSDELIAEAMRST